MKPSLGDVVAMFREAHHQLIGNDNEAARKYFQAAKNRGLLIDFAETMPGVFELHVPFELRKIGMPLVAEENNDGNG